MNVNVLMAAALGAAAFWALIVSAQSGLGGERDFSLVSLIIAFICVLLVVALASGATLGILPPLCP